LILKGNGGSNGGEGMRSLEQRVAGLGSALAILVCFVCASCSTAHETASILLPPISVPGVHTDHTLKPEEVSALSSEYFRRFVCGCGMPDTPVGKGEFWEVQLWGGIVGTDYGHFLISKDGRRVILEPPRSGLRSSTRHLLSGSGVQYEKGTDEPF